MPVACGSVGDIIAVALLVKDLASALNDCRGSSNEFKEVLRELQSLERALREVNVLATKHEATQELHALVEAARAAAQACRQSIDSMLHRVRRYQESLRHGGSGNLLKDGARKVQWKILESDEVDRFRAEVSAHANSLNIVLISASIAVAQVEGRKTRDALQQTSERLKSSNQAQDQVLARILCRVEDIATQISSNSVSIQFNGLQYLATVFKTMMAQISSSIFGIYQRVVSLEMSVGNLKAQSLLVESSCILVDALGRVTPFPLQFISSWDAFDAVLEVRFRDLPGHSKVCSKEFILLDSVTNRDIERSRPWDGAMFPNQRINMDMIFRSKRSIDSDEVSMSACPRCSSILEAVSNMFECTSCGFHYRVESAPSKAEGTEHRKNPEHIQMSKEVSSADKEDKEDLGSFRRVRMYEQIIAIPKKTVTLPKKKKKKKTEKENAFDISSPGSYSSSRSWYTPKTSYYTSPYCTSPSRRPTASYSYERTASLYYHTSPPSPKPNAPYDYSPVTPCNSYTPVTSRFTYTPSTREASLRNSKASKSRSMPYTANNYSFSTSPKYSYEAYFQNPASYDSDEGYYSGGATLPSYIKGPATSKSLAEPLKKKPPLKATAADAARARIPTGYSIKNWDPNEEPILLLGSVFDANSLGKWIYDWVTFYYGTNTPRSDVAGDLWLLLIQLAGKIKRAEEALDRVRDIDDKDLIEDFFDAGERLWARFSKFLKVCESHILRAADNEAKKNGSDRATLVGAKGGCEFVDTMFGRDRKLKETEKLMKAMRMWSIRFDANCTEILRDAGRRM